MITAGVTLRGLDDLDRVASAIAFLGRARQAYVAAGYDVQTLRLATQPLAEYAPRWAAAAALDALAELDRVAAEHDLYIGVGPVITGDGADERFPGWAVEVVERTGRIGFSLEVASPELGVHRRTVRLAAETMAALAAVHRDGEGNFLFAAAARIPAGTPFFPVAWSREDRTFAVGLESAGLVHEVLAAGGERRRAPDRLRRRLDEELGPLDGIAREVAAAGWRYLGMDVSPAPSPRASIGAAIEALTGAPFGSPETLAGCAALTGALGGVRVATCGYSGLMLPLLEDEVLARRAAEGRFGVSDLLRYSTVCGTGLDTVPLPGDTSVEDLARLVAQTAELAVEHRKPLSARLLPIPGKAVGDPVRIDNPHLIEGVVMDPAS